MRSGHVIVATMGVPRRCADEATRTGTSQSRPPASEKASFWSTHHCLMFGKSATDKRARRVLRQRWIDASGVTAQAVRRSDRASPTVGDEVLGEM